MSDLSNCPHGFALGATCPSGFCGDGSGTGVVVEADLTLEVVHRRVRNATLIEAYWKLRDHAAGSRETSVYQRAKEAYEADMTQRGYVAVEWKCRGIEVAARDLAEMLGVPESEIERPPGTSEVTDGR